LDTFLRDDSVLDRLSFVETATANLSKLLLRHIVRKRTAGSTCYCEDARL